MDADTKYKRWGWGAVAGLIGVILIAGLVVAVTMSSPKPNTELASNDTESSVGEEIATSNNGNSGNDNNAGSADQKTEEQKKAEEKKAAEEKAAQEKAAREKAEAEAKAAEDAKKKEAANSTDKTGGDSSDKVAVNNVDKMPKTGPEDNFMTIVAFAVIAGLVAYNISLKRQA